MVQDRVCSSGSEMIEDGLSRAARLLQIMYGVRDTCRARPEGLTV